MSSKIGMNSRLLSVILYIREWAVLSVVLVILVFGGIALFRYPLPMIREQYGRVDDFTVVKKPYRLAELAKALSAAG